MKHIKKISVWIITMITCTGIAMSSNMPVYAYNTEGSKTGDVVVTFTFTPNEKVVEEKEDTPTKPDKPKPDRPDPEKPGEEYEDDDPTDPQTPEEDNNVPIKPADDGKKPVVPAEKEKEEQKPEKKREKRPLIVNPFSTVSEKKNESKEEIVLAKEDKPQESHAMVGEYKKTISKPDASKSGLDKLKDVVPYIVGVVAFGVITAAAGVSGCFSALWLLILGIICRKKKKHWSGLLTYTPNLFVKVKGRNEYTKDMQDILNDGTTINELRTAMEASEVETILPVNTKMNIEIEGVEKEFDADEEIFYRELEGKHGDCIVSFYNGAAKLDFIVTMKLI